MRITDVEAVIVKQYKEIEKITKPYCLVIAGLNKICKEVIVCGRLSEFSS